MTTLRNFLLALGTSALLVTPICRAQPTNEVAYTLMEGSTLLDDCLICGRPTIVYPLRGTFSLVPLEANLLFARYRMTNLAFTANRGGGEQRDVAGTGLFQIGGEVAVVQEMKLDLRVGTNSLTFTNDERGVTRLFPLIEISLVQTQFNLLQFFSMQLVAAPVREIWFSTANGLTSANNQQRSEPGDVLSSSGRTVKSWSKLVARLNLSTVPEVPAIDALDIGPGGEILFSFDQNQTSATLGAIQHGDLVSSLGRIVARNQTLTREFGIMPAVPDVGLDAVMVKDDGEVLFSIQTDIVAERLGKLLRKGDVLSNRGLIVRSNAELLSRFHPSVQKDYGLDALYVWPSGEVWFSTEEGFQDQQYGPVLAGDLLSDQGLIVFRNLELLSPFAPLEDLADFGLDGLFVITDVSAHGAAPRWTEILHPRGTTSVTLRWEGVGRVYQVEQASEVAGPFLPLSPILPDSTFSDVRPDGLRDKLFYRLRQW
jgi:hypothetical protein